MSIWNEYAPITSHIMPLPKINKFASWTFRPPTFGDESAAVRVWNMAQPMRVDVLASELAYTFESTTIPSPDSVDASSGERIIDPNDPGFKPLIHKGATADEVKRALATMPTKLVEELWKEMKVVAPNWGEVKS